MSAEMSWMILILKNHCCSRRLYGAFLAWYELLAFNVLEATFLNCKTPAWYTARSLTSSTIQLFRFPREIEVRRKNVNTVVYR